MSNHVIWESMENNTYFPSGLMGVYVQTSIHNTCTHSDLRRLYLKTSDNSTTYVDSRFSADVCAFRGLEVYYRVTQTSMENGIIKTKVHVSKKLTIKEEFLHESIYISELDAVVGPGRESELIKHPRSGLTMEFAEVYMKELLNANRDSFSVVLNNPNADLLHPDTYHICILGTTLEVIETGLPNRYGLEVDPIEENKAKLMFVGKSLRSRSIGCPETNMPTEIFEVDMEVLQSGKAQRLNKNGVRFTIAKNAQTARLALQQMLSDPEAQLTDEVRRAHKGEIDLITRQHEREKRDLQDRVVVLERDLLTLRADQARELDQEKLRLGMQTIESRNLEQQHKTQRAEVGLIGDLSKAIPMVFKATVAVAAVVISLKLLSPASIIQNIFRRL